MQFLILGPVTFYINKTKATLDRDSFVSLKDLLGNMSVKVPSY